MLHEIGHQTYHEVLGLLDSAERAEFAAAVLGERTALTAYSGTFRPADLKTIRAALEAGGAQRDEAIAAIAEELDKDDSRPHENVPDFVNETWAEATAFWFGLEDGGRRRAAGPLRDDKNVMRIGRGAKLAAWKRLRPAFKKIMDRLDSEGWGELGAPLNAAARVLLVPALDKERQKYRVDWREKSTRGKKADLFVKTFLIDDTRNRNGWRASWPSIKRASQDL